MNDTRKALVIGDDTRSFLATVRSLGRQGIEVHAAPYNLQAPALASRYVHKVHRLPYYLDGGQAWLQAVVNLMRQEQFSLVIPCEERALLPLFKHRDELPPGSALAIPDAQALEAFFDKINTRALAQQCGVPVAKGYNLSAQDTPSTVLQAVKLPLVAKYRKSYSWPDLYVRSSVKVLGTAEALADWMRANQSSLEGFFVEETVPGFGLGVSVLCSQGAVLQAFEHHRAHEQMGSSFYRKSAAIHPQRLLAVQRMAQAINYTGLAMFEFKHDPDSGQWTLLEVNARPWGSLPLPVAMGVDFPHWLYQLLVNGVAPGPQVSYANDVYARNLVSDLWQARAVAQNLGGSKVAALRYLMGWVAGFTRLLLGREYHDAFSWRDARPALLEMRQLAQEKLRSAWPERQFKALASRSQAIDLLRSHVRATGQPANVMFLCQGNICRSPYAEYKARQVFADAPVPLAFNSAGMLPRNSRPSPEQAIHAASLQGVDLVAHRSRSLTEDILDQSQLVVIFDEINLNSFFRRYPESKKPMLLIGGFSGGAGHTIVKDPEGKSAENFSVTYQQIDHHLADFRSQWQASGG